MIPLKGRKIVLIGGAGFIGHNLAIWLKKKGADVSVIDGLNVNNLLYLHSTNIDIPFRERYIGFIEQRLKLLREHEIPLYVEDARDYNKLCTILKKIQPQVIILLAAVSHANRSNKDPFNTFDHSLRTLENSLDNVKGMGIEHFIYFSSSMVYGHFPKDGVTEETATTPLGIYGNLKLAGEQIVKAYNNVFGIPYTIVRPSALYGERCVSRRVGQIFIENAIANKEIIIHGDGEDRLDFTYIEDLCQGIECVLKQEKAKGETFNLTYGESRSIKQMVDILKQFFPKLTIRKEEKDRLVPDRGTLIVDKAKSLIDYNPTNPIEESYSKYIKWYLNNKDYIN